MIVEQLCLLICLLSAPCLPKVLLQEAEEEVASLNQFMDAVLRRMSAGLRAKLMDPMELGLQPRQAEDPRINRDNSRIGRGINKTLDETSRGTLTGLATLRRAGDVSFTSGKDQKILSCQFTVGPLQLEVSKSVSFYCLCKKYLLNYSRDRPFQFGSGGSRTLRTAAARTGLLTAEMRLGVEQGGAASIVRLALTNQDQH